MLTKIGGCLVIFVLGQCPFFGECSDMIKGELILFLS